MSETRSGGQEPVDLGPAQKSVGDLASEVTGSFSQVMSLQIELARLEIQADARRVAKGTGLLVAAGLIAHLIVILASVTLAFGLAALGLPAWGAFLIVTCFYLLVAVVLGLFGVRSYKKMEGIPRSRETFAATKSVLRRESDTAR
ncbi:phage holin family protein [Nocardiopsis ansamitocini]|uniref:phage holin family protein n=1 Tax=Nocardiopsis ansamitocini TaxID=1670832 RepID=UPI002556855A|nr:phage holin family protein [Nocardiopsis ansamitocini]